MDLIVGLPKQTVESFSRTLDRVVVWAPDRLAVFRLCPCAVDEKAPETDQRRPICRDSQLAWTCSRL
jgi:coproporphyrinogen III oxidase-like Fe-S oxidoreductase